MILNYLTIALRNLRRNKVSSIISITGLGLGIAASLLIGLWIREEISMDTFHTQASHTFYVMERQFFGDGKIEVYNGSAGLLSEELQKRIPEITYANAFTGWTDQLTFQVGDKINKESGHYAGKDFFNMFSFPILQGKPATALNSPTHIAISRKLAGVYFGSPQAAIGKTIRIDNRKDYQVSAVFEDVTDQSSIKFDFLLPYQVFLQENSWAMDWEKNPVATFIQIRPDADLAKLEAKIKLFLMNYRHQTKTQLFLQRYDHAYLYSKFTNGQADGGRIEYVRLFCIIAGFILLIACINFMNLATAQSGKRAKEVGIRKVMGAVRPVLIGQFMMETLLLTLLSALSAVVITVLLLPWFNQLTGKHIQFHFLEPTFLILFGGLIFLTCLLAGSYPALFLSSLKPVQILKGLVQFKPQARFMRQGLVIIQFAFSILLMVGTFVIYQQVIYLQEKDSGFNRENLIYLPLEGELARKYPLFKQELTGIPGINASTLLSQVPTNIDNGVIQVSWAGKNPQQKVLFTQAGVGYDFVKTLRLSILQGRDFSSGFRTDTASYLINESAAKVMGFANPIGQKLSLWGYPGRIIGVLKDFHFESLHTPIEPLVIYLQGGEIQQGSHLIVRTQPGQTHLALKAIQSKAKQIDPAVPFRFKLANDDYQKNYKSEQIISELSACFACLSIFITCLGILGLVIFMAEQRRKEIGIRKVLGASVSNIVVLFCKEFTILVLIAFVGATPIVGYIINQWLQNFAYHIELTWWMFAVSGLFALLMALLIVGWQAIKAALTNSVKSLRNE